MNLSNNDAQNRLSVWKQNFVSEYLEVVNLNIDFASAQ